MPVPTSIDELSQTPGDNPPDGDTDSPNVLDDHQRQMYAFIKELADRDSDFMLTVLAAADAAAARATLGALSSANGAVGNSNLATGAVGTSNIVDANVTPAKLSNAAFHSVVGTSKNLVITNNSGTPNSQLDIDANEVVLKDSSGRAYLASAVNLTVDIAASGANGLDTGTEANSTWYYAWVIYNGTTVSGLLSASSTAPTLPSGYTYSALLGAIYNDSSGNFLAMIQLGNAADILPIAVVSGGTATSYTSVSLSAAVPTTAKRARGRIRMSSTSATARRVDVAADANETAVCSAGSAAATSAPIYAQWNLPMKTAQTLFYRVTADSAIVEVTGWEF